MEGKHKRKERELIRIQKESSQSRGLPSSEFSKVELGQRSGFPTICASCTRGPECPVLVTLLLRLPIFMGGGDRLLALTHLGRGEKKEGVACALVPEGSLNRFRGYVGVKRKLFS